MNPKSSRLFRTSSNKKSISDPFQPNKQNANKDIEEFVSKKKASGGPVAEKIRIKDDSLLGRFVQRMFNPKPLNIQIRQKFNLNENYRMIYIIDNERTFMIIHTIINSSLPIFVILIGAYLIAELNGTSLLPKSVEEPYFFLFFLSIWFAFAYFMSTRIQSTTIFRIYYNQKDDKFAFVRMKGFLKFEKEDFVRQNVIIRAVATNQSEFVKNLTKNFGNLYINNRLRNVDFRLFYSNDVIQKMVGKKQYDILRNKSIIKD